MIRISLRFTGGRFHATPWGHHVNEGVAEWPPSPWRLLRGLAATLHSCGGDMDASVAWRMLTKLTEPPMFTLPSATIGQTRHYLSLNKPERYKTALTFDSFVAVDPASRVVVHWPYELGDAEREVLSRLLERLPYVGRAESWCDAALLADDDAVAPANCLPSDGTPVLNTETVRVLCPGAGVQPADLERTTAGLQREGWTDPPGTRWVFYRRAADAFRPAVGRARRLDRGPWRGDSWHPRGRGPPRQQPLERDRPGRHDRRPRRRARGRPWTDGWSTGPGDRTRLRRRGTASAQALEARRLRVHRNTPRRDLRHQGSSSVEPFMSIWGQS
ncbi:MAG: type I-U CRISPR-associated protein Cas5/Cas6 [Acidobacteria bacterium]|nr:type I-U CRISPR-associated protein Cas5/Cas6 [Acidobacteriota bacterium]